MGNRAMRRALSAVGLAAVVMLSLPAAPRAVDGLLAGDEILWVPGLPPADSHRLTGPAKGALRLTWNASRVGSTLPA